MQEAPLADRMRPQTLTEFVGQEHLVSKGKILRALIESDQLVSLLFWGPPGVGKTTLAHIIAHETKSYFVHFSAIMAGVADIKKVVAQAEERKKAYGTDTILFVDEIHRFNKAQQDAFLPSVEKGSIVLIGATTENPSFEVISPLLSRCRVLVLNPLEEEHLGKILDQALQDKKRGLGMYNITLEKGVKDMLLTFANGDARTVLNGIELAFSIARRHNGKKILITEDDIKQALQKEHLMYDKKGEEHYNTISAFIKSMRASNADAALYYLGRMIQAGEDPLFIARRCVIFASEDVGLSDPKALLLAVATFQACERVGLPECQINLAHCTSYLAKTSKDRSSYNAYFEALSDVKTFGNLPIPLNLRNAPTDLMKELGYGKGYDKYTADELLPEKLKGKKYLKK